ncbi:unnamed protein product [Calicophoron daubneyi]|uniref:FERM domain-containing protein n=1 Tax=Calicophoron daubneyi TaxID=300641 RepID=A0AAV2T9H1_CALDB
MTSSSRGHKRARSEDFVPVVVRFLEDDTSDEVYVPEDATGKWLFDEICRRQGITEEREYFGLRYLEREMLSSPTKQWLDLSRSVEHQLKNTHPRVVSFRIKHYPADPAADIKLPKTYYLLYRQLRRDLCSGRLVAPPDEMIRLGALVMQVELGDSSAQDPPQISAKNEVEQTYLSDFKVLHNHTRRTESLLLEEHKKLEGMLPSEAAGELIQLASSLETYGVDPIRVKTKGYGSRPIHLGLTHRGVAEFVSQRCQKLYLWPNIVWMKCDGRRFILAHAKPTSNKRKQTIETVTFKCETAAVARALWEWASDRHLFLTLDKSSAAKPVKSKRGLFSRTHTFKFSGRCRREILGRPTFAATLPADLSGASRVEQPEYLSGNRTRSGNIYSQSMVTLQTAPLISEGAMMPIDEQQTEDQTELTFGDRIHVSSKLMDHGSLARSQTSALQSTFSEPLNASQSPLDMSIRKKGASLGAEGLGGVPFSACMVHVHAEQMAPFFEDLPRRRYAPLSEIRQRKLIKNLGRRGPGVEDHGDIFDTDDEKERNELSSEAAIAALDAAADAGEAWADATEATHVVSESLAKPAESAESLSMAPSTPVISDETFLTPNHQQSLPSSQSLLLEPKEEVLVIDEHTVTSDIPPEQEEQIVPTTSGSWGFLAVSAGLLTGVSALGMAFLLETEAHSPIASAIRENPWFVDFETRYYRPFRNAVLNFWRR